MKKITFAITDDEIQKVAQEYTNHTPTTKQVRAVLDAVVCDEILWSRIRDSIVWAINDVVGELSTNKQYAEKTNPSKLALSFICQHCTKNSETIGVTRTESRDYIINISTNQWEDFGEEEVESQKYFCVHCEKKINYKD